MLLVSSHQDLQTRKGMVGAVRTGHANREVINY